jgi:hypothetical protein
MSWEITDFEKKQKNTLQGLFAVEIDGMKIKGWSVRSKDGDRWVNPSATAFKKDDGTTGYAKIVYIEEKVRWHKFQDWALSEIDKLAPATADPVQGDDRSLF